MSIKTIAQRCHLSLIYQAVGRGGEIGQSAYPHFSADAHFGGLSADWTQIKTAKLKSFHVFNHSSSVELDVIHALACYLISTKDRAGDTFLFPDLQQLSKGVAAKVSTVFTEFDANTSFTSKVLSMIEFVVDLYLFVLIVHIELTGRPRKHDCGQGISDRGSHARL